MIPTLEIDAVWPSDDLQTTKISWVWRYYPSADDLVNDLNNTGGNKQ